MLTSRASRSRLVILVIHVGVKAAGVAFRALVVQMPPPPGGDGPQWLFGRLASGVGARPHTRSAPLDAVPGRFVRGLVRCPTCGGVSAIRCGGVFSPCSHGGVIVL